jgi:hypothetical protein
VGFMGLFAAGSEDPSLEISQRPQRLWIAVLQQAVEDAKGNVRSIEDSERKAGSIQREALTWIFHGIPMLPNSFDSICGILEIDPDRARQRLRLLPGIRRGLDAGQVRG